MPLRDHFRPPVSKRFSWEGFHAAWPTYIVEQLRDLLPQGYIAEPRVRLGTLMEIDIGALESNHIRLGNSSSSRDARSATACWTATLPTVAVDTDPPEEYEYEVLIFDVERDRQLVAAIEFVSLANKDRPQSRDTFVAKCAALLRKGVAVSIVDIVTTRHFNLYGQLMTWIEHPDATMNDHEPFIYAASCRWFSKGAKARLEAWSHTLTLDQSLPRLPLWLADDLVVPLDLEASYERACHVLWIS